MKAQRPKPSGRDARGIPVYAGVAVRIYRLLNRVTQTEVADRLRVAQNYVSRAERAEGNELQARQAELILDAIDDIVVERERLEAEGVALAKAVKDRTWRPEFRGKYAPLSDAAMIAAGRGGEIGR